MGPKRFPLGCVASLALGQAVIAGGFSRIDIPLTFDGAGRYVVGVSTSAGLSRQNFSFAFTTGSGLTYIAGAGENSQHNLSLYNETSSLTARVVNQSTEAILFGQPTNTTVVKESYALLSSYGTLWQNENQTIFVTEDTQNNTLQEAARVQLGSEISGIIGLGVMSESNTLADPSLYDAHPEDTFIGQWLHQNPSAENFTFGLDLNPPVTLPLPTSSSLRDNTTEPIDEGIAGTSAGVLHLLQPDSSSFDPESIVWVNTNSTGFPRSQNSVITPSPWTIVLDGWSLVTKYNSLKSPGGMSVDIDPLYTGLYIPFDQALLIHSAIPDASLRPELSTLGNLSQSWAVPCDASLTFTLLVGGQQFTLDQSHLVTRIADGTCISGIEAWTDGLERQYVFGAKFVSSLYLIFNVPRTGTPSIGFANKRDSAASMSHSASNVKAIVGGVIGGLALLTMIILGLLFFRRKWLKTTDRTSKRNSPPPCRDEEKTPKSSEWHVHPFTMPSPTSVLEYQSRRQQRILSASMTTTRHTRSTDTRVLDRFSISVGPPTSGARSSCRNSSI